VWHRMGIEGVSKEEVQEGLEGQQPRQGEYVHA
jgi:hypothetical protein